MVAVHRHTGADSHASSASTFLTSRTRQRSQQVSTPELLNHRQAVIAVMAANGRTNRQISLRLRIPVQAIEQYLNEALDILRLSSQHELTHPVITAHLSKTSPAPKADGPQQGDTAETTTAEPPATTPALAPHTPHGNPTPVSTISLSSSSVAATGTVPNLADSDNHDNTALRGSW